MSEPKHTPGPWTLKHTSQARLIGNFDENGNGTWVASLPTGAPFENAADARLIAAAPALARTLEIIKLYCETAAASNHDEIFLHKLRKEFAPIIKECDRTLAKVEGRS